MATRMYFSTDAAAFTPSVFRGTWGSTASASNGSLELGPVVAANTKAVSKTSATNPFDMCMLRLVSQPAGAAATITGTLRLVMGAVESNAAANDVFKIHAYVTTGASDTVRGTLLSNHVSATEFPTTAAGVDTGAQAVTSTAVQVGDRIVIEIGYRSSTATTTYSATVNMGNQGTTDLTSGSTSVTTQPGWVEFSGADGIFAAPVQFLADNFDDNSRNLGLWDYSYGTVAETGGRAQVACLAGVYSGYASLPQYYISGSSAAVQVAVVPGAGGSSGAYAYMGCMSNIAGTAFSWQYNPLTGVLAAQSQVGFSDATPTNLTYSAVTHAWWRIRESAGTVYWDTSTDGLTWTNRRTQTTPAWVTRCLYGQLIFEANRTGGSTSGTFEVDNLNTTFSATANQAAGTGTGYDATASVAANADQAAGTGTAYDATVATSASVTADHAAGTGTAYDATVAVAANADQAAGTGTAYDATAATSTAVTANADQAAGTGTAYDATVAVTAAAGQAAGTGTAYDATVAVAATAGQAAGAGTAYDATASTAATATADHAAGTGTAYDATVAVTANADHATGTGTAYDATVSTTPKVSALVDDFGTQDAGKWLYTGTSTATGGQAVTIPDASYASQIMSVALYDLTSSVASVELVNAPVGAGTIGAFFLFYESVSNDTTGFVAEGGSLVFRHYVGGVDSDTSVTYSSVDHRWLRLTNDGVNLIWETSPDRVTWTTQRTRAVGRVWNTVQVQLFSGYYGVEPVPGTVVFDNLNTAGVPAASPTADVASGVGTAYAATVAVAAAAGTAVGVGTAYAATVDVAAAAGAAASSGTAYDATVSALAVTNAPADLATGTGSAAAASVAVAPTGGLASATGTAYAASVAHTYYVDPAGSDAADGYSTGTAWATLARVVAATLRPGDSVLFKRGGTWVGSLVIADSGQAGAPILIGAYGSGALPIIDGGGTNTTPGTVNPIEVVGNWVTVEYVQTQHAALYGIVVYGNDIELRHFVTRNNPVGVEHTTDAVGALIHDFQAIDNNIGIFPPGGDDDWAAMGIDLGGSNIEVYNFFITGSITYSSPDYGTDGSAIEIYGARNCLIRDGIATECESFTEMGNVLTNNVTFRNIKYFCSLPVSYGINLQGTGVFGPITGISVYNLTMVLTGASSQGVIVGPGAELTIKNSIIQANYLAYMPDPQDEEYNVWYGADSTELVSTHHATQSGPAPTSVLGNPLFIDTAGGNLHLANGSPAINRGTPVAWSTDLDGLPRAVGSAPDAGAYEWQGPNAELASGTGTALPATTSIGANAAQAAGTGTAHDPTASITAAAGHAASTGTAYDATVSTLTAVNASADLATGAGTAYAATVAVTVAADVATGTVTAYDATASVTATAGQAAGTGTAYDAAADATATAGTATGTGTAYDATTATSVSATADQAASTGTAYDPTASITATAGHAASSGTAYDAGADVAPTAGVAAGTGTAYAATVDTTGETGTATGTGTAYAATVDATAGAGTATATGTADAATAGVGPLADAAVGVGVGYAATVATTAVADVATSTGTAYDATVNTSSSVTAAADTATGVGVAYDASAAVTVAAGHATAAGDASPAVAAVGAVAGTGTAVGVAYDAAASSAATAGAATGTGTAYDATVSTSGTAAAGTAVGAGAGYDPAAAIGVNATTAAGTGTAYDASIEVATAPVAVAAFGVGVAYAASVDITAGAGTATGVGVAHQATAAAGTQTGAGTGRCTVMARASGRGRAWPHRPASSLIASVVASSTLIPDVVGSTLVADVVGH